MRESQTVRCPKCGGVLDAYCYVKSIHFDSDIGPVGSIVIEWVPSVVEGHECRFQGYEDDWPAAWDVKDTPTAIWNDAGSGALDHRTSRKGRPIVDVHLP